MNSRACGSLVRFLCVSAVSLATSALLPLAGCGTGFTAGPGNGFASTDSSQVITGRAMGGYVPIVGATATLYETQLITSTGSISGSAYLRESATTQSDGSFIFHQVGNPCTIGDGLYITVSGGNSGAGANSGIFEAAFYQLCTTGSIPATTTVINELSTVAIAYAMNNFITMNGTTLNLTAPQYNNYTSTGGATVPSFGNCTSGAKFITTGSNNVSTGTTCTANGVAHAGNNATAIVQPDTLTFTANSTIYSNTVDIYNSPTYNSSTPTTAIPAALINTISDIVQSCINSVGGAADAFSTPTTPTSGAGSVASLGFATSSASTYGTVHITFAGGTPFTIAEGTSGSPVSQATFVSNLNANSTFSADGLTATSSGTTVNITGPAGAANTLSFTGTTLNGAVSDTSTCGKFFALTPSVSGTYPTNTMQALLNMVKNPYVSAANVTALYGLLGSSNLPFNPTLTAAPHDWTVAFSYPIPQASATNGNLITGQSSAYMLDLDADDNAYVAVSPGSQLSGLSPYSCIISYGPDGTLRSPSVNNGSDWGCNAISSGTSVYLEIVPDALGNLWTANFNGSGSGSGFKMLEFSSSTGSFENSYTPAGTADAQVFALAVDKNNNVDFTINSTNSSNPTVQTLTYSYPSSVSTWTASTFASGSAPNFTDPPRSIALDAFGNIWAAENGTVAGTAFGGVAGVIPSSAITPAYNLTTYPVVQSAAIGGGSATNSSSSNSDPYGVAIDALGNAWVSTAGIAGITELTTPTPLSGGYAHISSAPTVTSTVITSGITSPKFMEVDGANNLWAIDTTGIHEFTNLTATPVEISPSGGFVPCYLGYSGNNQTTCFNTFGTSSKSVAVDSSGDVWYLYPGSTSNAPGVGIGRIYEILGTGFPTWPLRAQQQPAIPAGCTKSLANGCN